MIKKILIALALLIAGILIAASFRPNDFKVSRSATLAASPAALFDLVNNQKKFNTWNPFEKADPSVKNTYTGPEAGVGSACAWAGNGQVGEGKSTIIESKPGELVRFKMEFLKPMAGNSTCDFAFKPEGDKTVVTWSMYGPASFPAKVMGLFINCDKMCGDQFEIGLASLGQAAAKK